MPRDLGLKQRRERRVWGQVPCPQTCPHLGVPEDTPLMEWLKASQRDASGGESQPRFTAFRSDACQALLNPTDQMSDMKPA